MATDRTASKRTRALEAASSDEIELTFWARFAVIVAIALVALVGPGMDGYRVQLFVLAAIALPVNLALWAVARRMMDAVNLVVIVDSILLAVACFLVPPLCAASMVVLATSAVAAAAFVPARYPAIGGVIGLAGILIATPDDWLIIGVAAGATAGAVYAVAQTRSASRARGRYFGHLLRAGATVPVEVDAETGAFCEIGPTIDHILGVGAAAWDDDPRHHLSLLHPDDRAEWDAFLRRIRVGANTWTRVRLRKQDGTWAWVRFDLQSVVGVMGSRLGRGLIVDATSEHTMHVANERSAGIIDRLGAAVATFRLEDPDDEDTLVLESLNPAGRRLLPDVPDVDRPVPVLKAFPWIHPEDVDLLVTVAQGGEGGVRRNEQGLIPAVYGDPVVDVELVPLAESAVAVLITDVTDRHTAEAERQYRSEHDDLSGLLNRSGFRRVAGESLAERGAGDRAAMLVIDLSDFESVNQTLGHTSGDAVLIEVGDRLTKVVGDRGIVARVGGDEFAVFVAPTEADVVWRVAREAAAVIRRPVPVADVSVGLGVSVGVALAPDHAREHDVLLRYAGLAMREAKAERRTVVGYRPEIDQTSVRRLRLAGELSGAIRTGQLVVHYQPKFDLDGGRLVGAEALARWEHPELGLLQPADFLDLARVGGLIPELTGVVLDQLLRDREQFERHLPGLELSFNLTAAELVDPAQLDEVLARIDTAESLSGGIVVEITEEQLMGDADRAVSAMGRLRAAGIGVSIDDFGTGYSAMAYLAELPVSEVKIDRALVSQIGQTERAAAVVRSIIDLAHELKLAVVAEGIEDEETLAILEHAGCDLVQGFLLGRPASAQMLTEHVDPIAGELATGT